MQKYKSNITTTSGAAVRGAPVLVIKEDGSNAALFLDRAGTVPAPNPLTTGPDGVFYFYAVNGRYSIRTTVEGVTITDDDVVLLMDPEEITVAGPIAEAVAAAQAAAIAAEFAVEDSGIPVLVAAAQNAVVDANNAVSLSATSANNAAISKTGADSARDAAVAAKNAAEAALDSFDDRYLGAKAVAPTTDNDGGALLPGALYWDTVLGAMRAWSGSVWVTLPATTAASISYLPSGTGAMATTVQSKLREVVSVKDFGAVGDGVTDDSNALELMWQYIKASAVNYDPTALDWLTTRYVIPPGKYRVTRSINWTKLRAWNVHIEAEGALILAEVSSKAVIDMCDCRGVHLHGLAIQSATGFTPDAAFLIGPSLTSTCGNNRFSNVKTAGSFAIAAFGNIGSETTMYDNCYFQNKLTGRTYGYAADGCNRLGFTSAYVNLRAPGVAVSFTANAFSSCRFAHYSTTSTGAPFYGEAMRGWSADLSCYFLAFTGAALKIRSDATARCSRLDISGLFETTQAPGLDYALEFLVPAGTASDCQGFRLNVATPHAKTAIIKMTDPGGGTPGTLALGQADIEMGSSYVSNTLPMFDTAGRLAVFGSIRTKFASNLNLGDLSAFNGMAEVDTYGSLASVAAAGGYVVYSKSDTSVNHCGTQNFPSAPFTFTPTVTFATPGDLAVAYSVQSGWGYKVGKMVFFNIAVTFTPTHTTASGEFRIAGLPYPGPIGGAQDTAIQVSNINTGWAWPASATMLNARMPANSGSIRMYAHGNGIASTVLTSAHVPSGTAKSLILSGSYLTA